MTVVPHRTENFPPAPAGSLRAIGTREQRMEACLGHILESEGVPPFAEHARELLARSMDPDGASSQLARVILKDLGLTSQILRVANSSLYNRSGKPIVSVAHAITMLGWNTVRDMVSAMRFVEHYARHSAGLRELMMLSVLSATHGRLVASAVEYAKPEEAYVCGLFRNLGEVLMAQYYAPEYAEMVALLDPGGMSERAAELSVFGFEFAGLSRRLADLWALPAPVRISLGAAATSAQERCLASVVGYSHQLTTALYRRAERFDKVHLETVLDASGRKRTIAPSELREIVDSAIDDTRATFAALRIPMTSLNLKRQAEQARELLDQTIAQNRVVYDVAALDSAILDVRRFVESGGFDVTRAVMRCLEAVTLHAGFERAGFALISDDGSGIRARLVSGEGGSALLERFGYSLLRSDPALYAAVTRKQDLWVVRAADGRFDGSRIVADFEPSHFVLLPVVVDAIVTGAVYADRGSLHVADEVRPILEQLRGCVARAIARAGGKAIGGGR